MTENYESAYWGLIYDQMMEGDCADWLAENRAFYRRGLDGVTGPIVDCACGTGLFMLPLLEDGFDMHGFDASDAMLSKLRQKAHAAGIDVESRLSRQRLESFFYDSQFAASIIPSNTFGMLTTQTAQIDTLTAVHRHLQPGGRLLLDLRLAGVGELAQNVAGITGRWHEWVHPDTGRTIRQRIVDQRDLLNQLYLNRCYFEYDGDKEDFAMHGRWIFPSELQLLLRIAGFGRWQATDTDGGSLAGSLEETSSFWIAWKD